jgi:hypothetical protein
MEYNTFEEDCSKLDLFKEILIRDENHCINLHQLRLFKCFWEILENSEN